MFAEVLVAIVAAAAAAPVVPVVLLVFGEVVAVEPASQEVEVGRLGGS